MKSVSRHWRVGLLALTLASLLWGFRLLLFDQAPYIFSKPQEDMSFGWYVPLFSLYVVWSERDKLRNSLGTPGFAGFVLTLFFLLIGFLGVRGFQVRFEILSFAGLLVTIPWAFYGRQTAKRLLFPAAFLLFCIPLSTFLDVATVHLRLFATSAAYSALKGVGADVVRTGTAISSATGAYSIDVAEPCSGLRSIFALMALTAGYAYFNQPTWLRRTLLFALSIPLAVFGNIMRIFSICFVASFANKEFATGFYHDYSGYIVFIVAIVLMVCCGELITRAFDRRRLS